MGFIMKYKMKGFKNELATLISVVDILSKKKCKLCRPIYVSIEHEFKLLNLLTLATTRTQSFKASHLALKTQPDTKKLLASKILYALNCSKV